MVESISVDTGRVTVRGTAPAGTLSLFALPAHLPSPMPTDGVEVARRAHPGGAFSVEAARTAAVRDLLYARFLVTVDGKSVDGVCWPTDLSGLDAPDYPYPSSPTLKGLQVRMIDDALELGVGHAALNLSLNTVLRGPGDGAEAFVHDGRTYYADTTYLEKFDAKVKALSDHGIVVTLILLNGLKWDGVPMADTLRAACIHPDYDDEGLLSAFPVTTDEGLRHFRAFASLAARRYTRPDQAFGRACGFVVGNEVDSGWIWNNAGEMPVDEAVRQGTLALRTVFLAAREAYAQARVYLSLDHLWTIPFTDAPLRFYRGRDILDGLAATCAREGDFDWSVAFHPYPEDLSHADFWNDATAVDSFDSPRITFKNLAQLPAYLDQERLRYDGRRRHIILSEQGFHSEPTPEGEEVQAAAYALAYDQVARTEGIESFILHAHVDNRDEFDLNLGLWRRDPERPEPSAPGAPKPIHAVFKDIDGPKGEALVAWARGVAQRTPRRG